MSYRRVLIALFALAAAALACTVGSASPTSSPPTSAAPTNTPRNFRNGGVTPEAPTELAPTSEAPTEAPPTKAPTQAPTKAPTKAPKPTATEQQASSCDALAANGDAYFLANSQDANPQKIDSYPADATEIVPAFDFECNPSTAQLVVVYSFNGKQVYSGKHTLDAVESPQTFWTSLSKNDGTAMDAGQWGVEFFNNKQPLASGEVMVGEANATQGASSSVTVEGTITNKAGGKPISGAIFMVLNPGVTIEQFVNDNTPDSEIFSFAQTDSSGQFTLPDTMERNQKYSVLVGAKGYKTLSTDDFLIKDSDPDPLQLDIQLSK